MARAQSRVSSGWRCLRGAGQASTKEKLDSYPSVADRILAESVAACRSMSQRVTRGAAGGQEPASATSVRPGAASGAQTTYCTDTLRYGHGVGCHM